MNEEIEKIRVLIVDDSALVRKLLKDILSTDLQIEVVGTAVDPYEAREKIKRHNPHVITLDVEMPKMDGLTFLRNLMRLHPIPVIMISTLTEKGADITLQALELGAVDFVAKPKIDIAHSIDDYAEEIISKVKIASHANIKCLARISALPKNKESKIEKNNNISLVEEEHQIDEIMPSSVRLSNFRTTEQVIALGASTGGTEALKSVIEALPANFPGIVIAQHIPAGFSANFANRLNKVSAMTVQEAKDGQQILRGNVYVAPGDYHLLVVRDGATFRCKVTQEMLINRQRPSVDVLFRSVAQSLGQNTIGAILTGMGKDGAKGIRDIKEAGACTIAQDEQTSVVWGMPGEAVKLGGIDKILPLDEIAENLKILNAQREKEVDAVANRNC